MRTRSPSKAPPVLGDEGSTAKTATRSPLCAHDRSKPSSRQDLPTPGAPVIANVCQTSSDGVGTKPIISSTSSIWIKPFSRALNVLASERRSPDLACPRNSDAIPSPQADEVQYQSLS